LINSPANIDIWVAGEASKILQNPANPLKPCKKILQMLYFSMAAGFAV